MVNSWQRFIIQFIEIYKNESDSRNPGDQSGGHDRHWSDSCVTVNFREHKHYPLSITVGAFILALQFDFNSCGKNREVKRPFK